jgi:hypothetical protein
MPECVGPTYARHDPQGDRVVTREAYAAELAKVREARPGIRVLVYDHDLSDERAWFRFAFKWTDVVSGEARSQAGMQVYRLEDGKLAGTWVSLMPLGSAWPDEPQVDWVTRKHPAAQARALRFEHREVLAERLKRQCRSP